MYDIIMINVLKFNLIGIIFVCTEFLLPASIIKGR